MRRSCRFTALMIAILLSSALPTLATADAYVVVGGNLFTVCASGCDFTSIQDAIDDAGTAAGDTIQVNDPVHTEPGIVVDKDLVIQGLGTDATIVQAAEVAGTALDRVFAVMTGSIVTIRDMTIRYGATIAAGGGLHNAGDLTLERCVITDNRVTGGSLSEGGGLRSKDGKIAIYDCTIKNNSSERGGGGMVLVDSAYVHGCTISDNSGGYGGGALLLSEHQEFINCTFSENAADGMGGGVLMGYNTATMTNCTVTRNISAGGYGGGVCRTGGNLTVVNTIIAGNYGGNEPDVYGRLISGGYNLVGDNTGSTSYFPAGYPNANNDWVGTAASPIDPLLGPLGDNGGLTLTHLPLLISPAKNMIPEGVNGMGAPPLDVDQRGEPRVAFAAGDIGSVEYQKTLPTVTTAAISNITSRTAEGGGEVTDDGNDPVTERGVCWNTTGNPTTADDRTSDGSGVGQFTSTITGLEPATTYYVRAYATNSVGTRYGDHVQFNTISEIPTVSTAAITEITSSTATSGGDVSFDGGTPVTARGVCWSTSANPTIADDLTTDGSGTGAFASVITGLSPGTTYHVRAYATNSIGTAYGDDLEFETLPVPPAVNTTLVTEITSATASSGGSVTDDGGAAVTARGVCWSASENPTLEDSFTTDGSGLGTFASTITGLTHASVYHVRAYATNVAGTNYGDDVEFETNPVLSTVTTAATTEITMTTATSGGEVTDHGGRYVTVRGVCWSTTANPTIADSHTSNGSGVGLFSSEIIGLSPGTTYHVRAYATTSVGTAYGDDVSFVTSSALPTVTTAEDIEITSTTATSGGEVTDDGGDPVTARGVCWGTSSNPTIAGNHTINGSGLGLYSSEITGLTPGIVYHVRAYATNGNGTSYGDDIEFTASAELPTVATTSMTEINPTTATVGGEVTGDGGSPVTARGVCWSTSEDPTIADDHTSNGSGLGTFAGEIIGLSPGTSYYVRTYATNGAGTAYGAGIRFKTTAVLPTVTTASAIEITPTTAISGGNVTYDGGASVTARGVCWSESSGPTIADDHTSDGIGLGTFTSAIADLDPTGTYYVRAYATNEIGTAYGDEVIFSTLAGLPVVVTGDITSIDARSAICAGQVIDGGGREVTARGICWSESVHPTLADNHTVDGAGTGTFASSISDLDPNTRYYVRCYATNDLGTVYGEERSFATLVALPTVTAVELSSITATGATCVAEVTDAGGGSVTARGFCWSTSFNPTTADDHTTDGTGLGRFTSSITDLISHTSYYARPYATNEAGTSYGAMMFLLPGNSVPSVATNSITSVTDGSALGGGQVISDGGDPVTARGICWSRSHGPSLEDPHTTNGTGLGSFVSAIIGLDPNVTYYVRAYATNGIGTAFGEEISFTTTIALPLVVTKAVVSITENTAETGGRVIETGGSAITALGVCWGTSENPTIAHNLVAARPGPGEFDVPLENLQPNTTYHVRAYATNIAGTSYGQNLEFHTNPTPVLSTVRTGEATSVDGSSFEVSWTVVSDGGSPIIDCGICWSGSPHPTLDDEHIAGVPGLGKSSEIVTGIEPNRLYYIRAYATTRAGTAYGNEITFGLFETALSTSGANPFSDVFPISFTLSSSGSVRLDVYDSMGRRVRTLVDQTVTSGMIQTEWDGKNDYGDKMSSGIYYLRLSTPNHLLTKRIALLR